METLFDPKCGPHENIEACLTCLRYAYAVLLAKLEEPKVRLYEYQLEGVELQKALAWETEHNKVCPYYDDGTQPASPSGAIGGRLTYSFTPTGIGVAVTIHCACGKEANVTDYDSW